MDISSLTCMIYCFFCRSNRTVNKSGWFVHSLNLGVVKMFMTSLENGSTRGILHLWSKTQKSLIRVGGLSTSLRIVDFTWNRLECIVVDCVLFSTPSFVSRLISIKIKISKKATRASFPFLKARRRNIVVVMNFSNLWNKRKGLFHSKMLMLNVNTYIKGRFS